MRLRYTALDATLPYCYCCYCCIVSADRRPVLSSPLPLLPFTSHPFIHYLPPLAFSSNTLPLSTFPSSIFPSLPYLILFPFSSPLSSPCLFDPITDLAKMLQTVGVDNVLSVDLQRPGQGHEACFFDCAIPVETVSTNSAFAEYFKNNIHPPLKKVIY
jgi:phosphoribosylpyrophosphate synthetase